MRAIREGMRERVIAWNTVAVASRGLHGRHGGPLAITRRRREATGAMRLRRRASAFGLDETTEDSVRDEQPTGAQRDVVGRSPYE